MILSNIKMSNVKKHTRFYSTSLFTLTSVIFLISFLLFSPVAYAFSVVSSEAPLEKVPLAIGLSSGNITFSDVNNFDPYDFSNPPKKSVRITNTGNNPVHVSFYLTKDGDSDHFSVSFFNLNFDCTDLKPGEFADLDIQLLPPNSFRDRNLYRLYNSDHFSGLKLHILYVSEQSLSLSAGFRLPVRIIVSNETFYSGNSGGFQGRLNSVQCSEESSESPFVPNCFDSFQFENSDVKDQDLIKDPSLESESSKTGLFNSLRYKFSGFVSFIKKCPVVTISTTFVFLIFLIGASVLIVASRTKKQKKE